MTRRAVADREDVLGVLMLAPSLAYVILLVGVPFFLAILLSFSNATAGSLRFEWAGFGNYGAILGDPIFQRALRNSVVVTVGSQALVVVLATAAAQVFRATFRGKRFARFIAHPLPRGGRVAASRPRPRSGTGGETRRSPLPVPGRRRGCRAGRRA